MMQVPTAFTRAATLAAVLFVTSSHAAPVTVAAPKAVEIAFSPRGGGQELIVKIIDSARQRIRVLAYSFTSPQVTAALLRAKKRGVDVALVVDQKSNLDNAKSRAALGALVAAGVAVRATAAYAIHHDKVVVVDGRHVQTGSYNFSDAAESRNSENILVLWDAPDVAAAYQRHWQRNWETGVDYEPAFGR